MDIVSSATEGGAGWAFGDASVSVSLDGESFQDWTVI